MKLKFLLSVVALMFIFGACNSDFELQQEGDFAEISLTNGIDLGIAYYISDQWVSSKGQVIVNTQFKDGRFWGAEKEILDPTGTYVIAKPANVVYNFTVRTSLGAIYEEFNSFCAHYGSTSFGQDQKYAAGTLQPEDKANILAAFNYIYDKYGSLDGWQEDNVFDNCSRPVTNEGSTKVIAQIVLWTLLDNSIANMYAVNGTGGWDFGNYLGQGLTYGGPNHAQPDGGANIAVAVADVLANYVGYTGNGAVCDLFYLVGPHFPDDDVTFQPQIIPIICDGPKGKIEIVKTVEGISITAYANGGLLRSDLMSFDLYKVNARGISITGLTPLKSVGLGNDGKIVFTGLAPGWYAIKEVITPAGRAFFDEAPVMYIEVGANGVQVGSPTDFDPNADYFVSWNWVQFGGSVPLKTVFRNGMVWDGIKAGTGTAADGQINEVQKITARTSMGAEYKELNAFCAHVGSWAYSGNSYASYVLNGNAKTKILSAFNYIYDTYGSLDGWIGDGVMTKVLAQMAVWYFLPPDNDDFKIYTIETKDYAELNAIWLDVLAAAENGYKGMGIVIGLSYLADSVNPGDLGNCQPQIIPIFGGVFNNIEIPKTSVSYGTVSATNAGNSDAILAGLNPKNGNPYYNDKNNPNTPFVVPNSNHFVFAELSRADLAQGVWLEFMNGNKFDIVGKGFVKLVGDNLVLTIDNYAGGSFGAMAFTEIPVVKTGNIHSEKYFNHDNVLTIPCTAGDVIYLYFHSGDLRFYL